MKPTIGIVQLTWKCPLGQLCACANNDPQKEKLTVLL